jgi:hypothetical protein
MASQDQKFYMLDSSASFNGTLPTSYVERIGLSFDMPEAIKLIKGIRARIYGNNGETVIVKVGYADNPYDPPTYTSSTHIIGSTIANDLFVSGRYLAVRFESGTAAQYRIDSFDIDVETMGAW